MATPIEEQELLKMLFARNGRIVELEQGISQLGSQLEELRKEAEKGKETISKLRHELAKLQGVVPDPAPVSEPVEEGADY